MANHAKGGLPEVGKGMLEYDWAGASHRYLEGLDRRRHAELLLFAGKDWTVCRDTKHWRENYQKESYESSLDFVRERAEKEAADRRDTLAKECNQFAQSLSGPAS